MSLILLRSILFSAVAANSLNFVTLPITINIFLKPDLHGTPEKSLKKKKKKKVYILNASKANVLKFPNLILWPLLQSCGLFQIILEHVALAMLSVQNVEYESPVGNI